MSEPFSIAAAARETPRTPALFVDGRVLSFADVGALVAARARDLDRDAAGGGPHPVVGEATLATIVTLYALLESRIPALLLHPRLTPPEREGLLAAAVRSGPLPGPDAAMIVYTSGTTGVPRAAVLSRGALLASARASEANLGWQPDDRWLLHLTLAHVGGLSILTRCLAARRCVVLGGHFEAEKVPQAIDDQRITLASLVPTMLLRVIDANPGWTPPPHLRAILLGGASASPCLLQRAAAARVPLVVSYGLTEACSQVTATPYAARFAPAEERSGRALPGIGVRVVDGRIEVRGPTLMTGYWNETPLAPGAWFDTGDVGAIDERGRLTVHARRTDLIVTGGENVYPAEVEAVLEACPGIAAAAVFGVPDEVWGQTVAAALVAAGDPPGDAALRAFLDARLAPHKQPRAIGWLRELPHTRGGKLDRASLADLTLTLRPL